MSKVDIRINDLGQRVNFTRSARLAAAIEAKDGHCWNNAIEALAYLRTPRAVYVEGHAVSKFGLVCEHGWLETGTGQILEVTPCWRAEGEVLPGYFPAVRYTREEISKKIRRRGCRVPLVHFPKYCSNEEYKTSYFDAFAYAHGWTRQQAEDFCQRGKLPGMTEVAQLQEVAG